MIMRADDVITAAVFAAVSFPVLFAVGSVLAFFLHIVVQHSVSSSSRLARSSTRPTRSLSRTHPYFLDHSRPSQLMRLIAQRHVHHSHQRLLVHVAVLVFGSFRAKRRRGGVQRRQLKLKGVRRSRKASRCVGIETVTWAERNTRREEKSLRIGVHHANAVVRGPV
jgi:hypothetical protein